MVGAGVFAAFGPAAAAAGTGLLIGLAIAAVVAYANATSSADLAARYPSSGGTYVYGRERLGRFWGDLAGGAFVVGKAASCAGMALTAGAAVSEEWSRPIAVAAIVVITAVNHRGIRKTVLVTRVLVTVVLTVLALVVAASLLGGQADATNLVDTGHGGVAGVLQSAGLLFFAFAGYARIATLGEEVEHPATTIPKAIPRALGITLAVYAAVAVAALAAVGPSALAASSAPLATAVASGRFAALEPAVRAGAVVASLGVLLSLVAGVSRTLFAMAADGVVPRALAAVHPRHQVPHRADLVVGAAVTALVCVTDLRHAIGFSSFCVLTYYAIANAAALTLPPYERRWPRRLAVVGVVGCVVLAVALPVRTAVVGAGVVVAIALAVEVRAARGDPPAPPRGPAS